MANVAKKQEAKRRPVPATAKAGGVSPFEALHKEIDRLFDDFSDGFRPWFQRLWDKEPSQTYRSAWKFAAPAIDVAEKDNAWEVAAELPGMDEKDIEVTVSEGLLTIKGETTEEKEEKDKRYHLSERHHGSFERTLSLPQGVAADKISAAFDKGVLTVTLPKTAESKAKQRKIAVKTK